jgi:hypothetical protein
VVQLTVVPSGWVIVVVVVGIFGDGGAMDGVEGSEGGQRKFCCFYLSEMNFDRASLVAADRRRAPAVLDVLPARNKKTPQGTCMCINFAHVWIKVLLRIFEF